METNEGNQRGTMDHDEEDLLGASDPESRVRTYLANERTFLSWFRTGITLVALGLAAAQFLTRDLVADVPLRRGIAIGFVLGGVVMTLTGAGQYFATIRQIDGGTYRPPVISVGVSTTVAVVVGLVAVGFIFLLR
jgi:inner membrane protein YidH